MNSTPITRFSLHVAAAVACTALAGCGYHHIGSAPAVARQEAGVKPQPTRVVPKKETTLQTPDAYFPLNEGSTYTYSRTYLDQGYVGTRVMTVSSAETGEAWVNNRLEGSGEMMALELPSRVGLSTKAVTAALPSTPGVHSLQSFALKAPLKLNAVWEADLEGRAWSFVARRLDTVTVPAGTYDCLVVEGTNRTAGIGTITLTKQTLYFAPGVGLVKLVLAIDDQRETGTISHQMTEALMTIDSGT
jgi:hypothetical protein